MTAGKRKGIAFAVPFDAGCSAPSGITHDASHPMNLATRELKDRSRLVFLPRLEDRRGELGMIGRIGKMLRLQTKTVPQIVDLATLALDGSIQEIPAIKLNPRLIGQHLQDSSRLRFVGLGRQ